MGIEFINSYMCWESSPFTATCVENRVHVPLHVLGVEFMYTVQLIKLEIESMYGYMFWNRINVQLHVLKIESMHNYMC